MCQSRGFGSHILAPPLVFTHTHRRMASPARPLFQVLTRYANMVSLSQTFKTLKNFATLLYIEREFGKEKRGRWPGGRVTVFWEGSQSKEAARRVGRGASDRSPPCRSPSPLPPLLEPPSARGRGLSAGVLAQTQGQLERGATGREGGCCSLPPSSPEPQPSTGSFCMGAVASGPAGSGQGPAGPPDACVLTATEGEN